VKSGGEVDITKLLSLLCRCNKALHVAAIFLLAGCGEDGQSRVEQISLIVDILQGVSTAQVKSRIGEGQAGYVHEIRIRGGDDVIGGGVAGGDGA
jgi:hypothetical protein